MGKIKDSFKKNSLKATFSKYMIVCILVALLISIFLSNMCLSVQEQIKDKYLSQYSYEVKIENSQNFSVRYYTEDITKVMNDSERGVYEVLGILSVVIYPVCFIFCIIVTSILFYKRQLDKPLTILSDAADNIARNNLDFKITYDKDNELGKLCASFEKMRIALQDNNLEMWRQIEERKRLNAAFSHDLRTPLTVLKGQSEMLSQYAPKMSEDKIISTAEMMKRHITRLEKYVTTMNDLQRLEDVEIKKEAVAVDEIEKQMWMTGMAICTEKEFSLIRNISDIPEVMLDISIVMQVYENLLSNAIRYAKTKIQVVIEKKEDFILLTVSDDGVGFTAKDLSDALKPFYKAKNETGNEHFGMGLNICKMLCEKHGGSLQISNESGANVVAAFKE
ncbi:MAG: HAMP domain-containing histidine kinase [Lachnospiraceae bacterium]|nr:HAMP domain-containing histidine kinase [Lachnospiraceae bacterium]